MNIPKLIGGIMLVSALGLLASGAYKFYLARQIVANGVTVEATVEKLWKKRGGPGRTDEHWAGLAFADETGERHVIELVLTKKFSDSLKKGDLVPLKFIAGSPKSAELEATAGGLRPALIPLVGGATFLGLALFLFLRKTD